MSDRETGFCVPNNLAAEYRSHYAASSRDLHVTFSCISTGDLSAGALNCFRGKEKKGEGTGEESSYRVIFNFPLIERNKCFGRNVSRYELTEAVDQRTRFYLSSGSVISFAEWKLFPSASLSWNTGSSRC